MAMAQPPQELAQMVAEVAVAAATLAGLTLKERLGTRGTGVAAATVMVRARPAPRAAPEKTLPREFQPSRRLA